MSRIFRNSPWLFVLGTLVLVACSSEGIGSEAEPSPAYSEGNESAAEPLPEFDVGTEKDRAALFDFLVHSTMEWDCFASLPNHPLYQAHPKAGLDVVAEMERYRDELIAADTDAKMWFALHKISNARKDRHLGVEEVEGGLVVPDSQKVQKAAPLRFATDFADPDIRFFFVADRGTGLASLDDDSTPNLRDRLVAVNGRPVNQWVEAWRPYQRYSTENHFWMRVAEEITRTRAHVPHSEFYRDTLVLELERKDGSRYESELSYEDPDGIQWEGHAERTYPGFSLVPAIGEYETFSLYLPEDDLPVVLLQWHGFEGDLPEAMDHLMEYAEEHDLLEHNVIVDATRAGGGSQGAYAVQRIQPQPFRTTFGNIKVSPGMERWVENQIERLRTGPASALTDDENWLLDWLETDVRMAIEADNLYTNDVPFKVVDAPKWSDGIIDPAPVHFRGKLTVWLNPYGGSHLDQFAAQVVDNNLGHVMGMPAGGYSNTWEITEVLRFPTTGAPIVRYQWSMGHTIRPNGEILQYNPAEVDEYIPQTRDNYFDYHARLLELTLQRLEVE